MGVCVAIAPGSEHSTFQPTPVAPISITGKISIKAEAIIGGFVLSALGFLAYGPFAVIFAAPLGVGCVKAWYERKSVAVLEKVNNQRLTLERENNGSKIKLNKDEEEVGEVTSKAQGAIKDARQSETQMCEIVKSALVTGAFLGTTVLACNLQSSNCSLEDNSYLCSAYNTLTFAAASFSLISLGVTIKKFLHFS